MEAFSALLAICAGNSPITGEFPTQRPVARSFDGFFDLCLNKWLSKQSWGWWFETLSCALWRHCNDCKYSGIVRIWPSWFVFVGLPVCKISTTMLRTHGDSTNSIKHHVIIISRSNTNYMLPKCQGQTLLWLIINHISCLVKYIMRKFSSE